MTLLLLCLSATLSHAQEATLEGIEVTDYSGFSTTRGAEAPLYWNYAEFYMAREGRLHLVSPELEPADVILVPKSNRRRAARSGDHAWFWLSKGKSLTVVQTDPSGQETGRLERPILAGWTNKGTLFPGLEGDAILLMPQKLAKKGIRIESVAPDLSTRWTVDLMPPKGALKVRKMAEGEDRIILILDGPDGLELAGVSKRGELLFRTPLEGAVGNLVVHPSGAFGVLRTGTQESAFHALKSTLALHDATGRLVSTVPVFDDATRTEVISFLRSALKLRADQPDPVMGNVYPTGMRATDGGFRVIAEVIHATPKGSVSTTAIAHDPWQFGHGQRGLVRYHGILTVDIGLDGTTSSSGVVDSLDRQTEILHPYVKSSFSMAAEGDSFDRHAYRMPLGDDEVLLNEEGNRFTIDLLGPAGIDVDRRIDLDLEVLANKGPLDGPPTQWILPAAEDNYHHNGMLYQAEVFRSALPEHLVVVTTTPGPDPQKMNEARTYNVRLRQVPVPAKVEQDTASDEAEPEPVDPSE